MTWNGIIIGLMWLLYGAIAMSTWQTLVPWLAFGVLLGATFMGHSKRMDLLSQRCDLLSKRIDDTQKALEP